jgi:hypothetical protein
VFGRIGALIAGGVFATSYLLVATSRADEFHGLNAGAPIWNGSLQLTSQRAQQFAATGTDSIRVNFRLDNGATTWNSTQLSMYDQVIANARNAGLKVLGLFSNETVAGGQGAWNNDPDNDGLNSYVTQYASTAQFLVNRYKNDVKTWELWNEPNAYTNPNYSNDPLNAGGTYILPRVYAQVLNQTYRSLNSAGLLTPGTKLVSGGLLAHDIGGSFSTAMDYMQQVYNRTSVWNSLQSDFGRRYAWDEFGYHFYLSQGSLIPTSQLSSYFNTVRSTQSTNSDPSKINVTEFGWQTIGSNTQQLQRDNMATAYNYMEALPFISGTYWYQWTDEPDVKWGITNSSGQPKLSYNEFVARNAGPDPDPPGSNVVYTTHHGTNDTTTGYSYSSTDLIQGKIATELPGDLGWHSSNPASGNPNNRNGLKAFTDGAGSLGAGFTGLLSDFSPAGSPAKLIDYDLGPAHDINEIRIFTSNAGNDGRIFSTTAVWSSGNGVDYDFLGYFQSDTSGTVNNSSAPGGSKGATVVRIFREDNSLLAEDVTHLRFHFYAVSSLEAQMRDPFNGVNPFTNVNDNLSAAYMSPMVREIDVFGAASPVEPLEGDYNLDGTVDAADYVAWRKQSGITTSYNMWKSNFGESNQNGSGGDDLLVAAPEPASASLVCMAALALLLRWRRAGQFVCPALSTNTTWARCRLTDTVPRTIDSAPGSRSPNASIMSVQGFTRLLCMK